MILNITPDHLNRYENSVEKYALSKLKIYENQDANDYLIISKDSEFLNQYFKKPKSNILFFSTNKKVSNGCYLEDDEVKFVINDVVEFSCKVSISLLKVNIISKMLWR